MVRPHTSFPERAPKRAMRGSAAVEFVIFAPFIIAMMALVWNLRQYTAYRTDVARETFVAAEMIANETGASPSDNPIPIVVERVMSRLAQGGSGTIDVTLVARGDRRLATATVADPDCADASQWCLPRVALRWPATGSGLGTWGGGGACAGVQTGMPDADEHFPADLAVLPNEVPPDAVPVPPQNTWLSRNLRLQEWWVVVDTCIHPQPGLLGGVVMNGLRFFDLSDNAFVFRKRAAWGSVHEYTACNWCP